MGMVGVQNADSGKALTVKADMLLSFERKGARGGERLFLNQLIGYVMAHVTQIFIPLLLNSANIPSK